MARPLRIEYPGALYYVTSRGNHRQDIFVDDEDRERFLNILAHTARRHNWLCHAYCLMDNHYHIVIEAPDGNLSKGMRQVGAVYTQAYNRRHGKSGHLFQGRYKAILVEKESRLLEVIRYVVLNPVRAGAVSTPEDWPWSSYRGTCEAGEVHPCLSVDWVLGNFGRERGEAIRRFRSFVRDGMKADSPFEKVRGQVALGGDSFFEMLQPFLEDKSKIDEIPRSQRVAGRPELDVLFAAVQGHKARNARITGSGRTVGIQPEGSGRPAPTALFVGEPYRWQCKIKDLTLNRWTLNPCDPARMNTANPCERPSRGTGNCAPGFIAWCSGSMAKKFSFWHLPSQRRLSADGEAAVIQCHGGNLRGLHLRALPIQAFSPTGAGVIMMV